MRPFLEEDRGKLKWSRAGLDEAKSMVTDAFGMCSENVALFFISDSTNTPGDDVATSLLAYASPLATRIFALDISPFDPDETINDMTLDDCHGEISY